MRGLLWIVAVAACGGHSGVQISALDKTTGAKEVRIFVGAGQPATRTITIAQSTFSDADTWFRDPGVDDESVKISDKTANFFFESTGAATQMPIVIAVGFDGDKIVGAGELMNVDVPSSGLLHYDLPLIPPPADMLTWDTGGKVTTAAANKCVGFGDHLIVASEDQDCDGNLDGTPKECDPDTYQGERGAIPDELTCILASPIVGPGSPPCLAGGPTCTDGTGPAGTCLPSQYCVPSELCGSTLCSQQPLQCLEEAALGKLVPRFECMIAIKHTGEICDGQDLALPQGSQDTCSNVRLRNDQQNFQSTLHVQHDPTDVTIQTNSDKCSIKFTPSGIVDVSLGTPAIKSLMAVDTGPAPFQGFLIPVVFRFAIANGTSSGGCNGETVSGCAGSTSNLVSDASVCN